MSLKTHFKVSNNATGQFNEVFILNRTVIWICHETHYIQTTRILYCENPWCSLHSRFSRFKIALLLPIKHRIIYITVKSTWNVITSTNTTMHYHGSKGSWKSCPIYGLLVCYTYSKYISTGVQRVQQKKKKHKMTLPVIMYQQHMRYMTSTLFN